jgi:hypothetical protein
MIKQHFLFLIKATMSVLKPILKAETVVDEIVNDVEVECEDVAVVDESVANVDEEVEKVQTEFETLNDFKEFYSKNKKKLDCMCTIVLNKTYKIQDYVIRKNYGVLNFRKVNKDVKVSKNEQRLTQLENAVNEVIEVLNQIQTRLGMI